MRNTQKDSIFEQCKKSDKNIPGDIGGGSTLSKVFLVSYLVQEMKLMSFLELGVYRGKSLFPISYSIFLNGGHTVGVDAYNAEVATEHELPIAGKAEIQEFFRTVDMEKIYQDLLVYKEECGFGNTIQIMRQTSNSYLSSLKGGEVRFDLIHIDANHDRAMVEQDYRNSINYLDEGGYIVFDDINWPGVSRVYEEAKQNSSVVFECETFGILLHQRHSLRRDHMVERLKKKLDSVYKRVPTVSQEEETKKTKISVGVLVYNQQDTIEQCLQSIISQAGDFELRVVVSDDCSTDGSWEAICNFTANQNSEHVTFETVRNPKNLGIMNNLQNVLNRCNESEYVSLIEGDDFYFSSSRLSKHLELHQKHPDLALSINGLLLLQESGTDSVYSVWSGPENPGMIDTKALIEDNYAGNLGSIFINSQVLVHLSRSVFDMFTGDWFLTIILSEFGSVRKIIDPINVYRKNGKGFWTSKSAKENNIFLLENLDRLNEYQDFAFDPDINLTRLRFFPEEDPGGFEVAEKLVVIDDIFPHSGSGFRFEEFSQILRQIPESSLYTTGQSCLVLGEDGVDELLIEFKRSNPDVANRVHKLVSHSPINAKLLYCDFLGNAYHHLLPIAEAKDIPFMFTLYPGGMFALDNEQSDEMLSKVLTSPNFAKVIVTQPIIRDYLLHKKLCSPEKIEFIWGVVVPKENLNLDICKVRYGFEKQTLDLCFVAHQYTPQGVDKGFDTFLEVARILSRKTSDVNFHIVGPWTKENHNVKGIENIVFHGRLTQDDLRKFYLDKDIIMSPNRPNMIFRGSFDGFPTAAVTDASLQKVAMLITDPLSLNGDRFIDGKEIVITPNDPRVIAKNVEFFMQNPSTLASIAEEGFKKSNLLFSGENQVQRRLDLIEATLVELDNEKPNNPEPETLDDREKPPQKFEFLIRIAKKITPGIAKRFVRKLIRLWARIRAV